MKSSAVFVILAAVFIGADTYKILCIFPHVAKSHFVIAEALMKGLAARGHHVTMISHFPQKNPIPNYTDISLVGTMPEYVGKVIVGNVAVKYVYKTLIRQSNTGLATCKNTLESAEVKKFMASNETFDLIVTELFNTDCFLGYVYKLKTPFIALSSSTMMPWAHRRFGNPNNPSYIGNQFLYHASDMDFKERIINVVFVELLRWVYYYVYEKPAYEIVKNYFGETLPPFSEIAKNTSILLVNSHFSLNQPRPLMPSIIEIGGLHLRSSGNKLTKEVQDFLDNAEDGGIYFSLGSSIRAESLPAEKLDVFLHAFSELPHRVLWKWEGESMPGKTSNIMTASWLPQMDVLAHPNVRVFITHAGLMGTMEAVYYGVPMVTIPLFGDQFHNAKCSVSQGVAVNVDYHTMVKDTVLSALKEALYNNVIIENAKRVQKAFRDRPVSPLDTAIYWTEYVIRHGGAPHLRSAAVDLPLYQYLLLDVIAALCLCTAAIFTTLYLVLRKLFSIIRIWNGQKHKSKGKRS